MGISKSQPNHFTSILPPLLWHVSLKKSYLKDFVLRPLPASNICTKAFCKEDFVLKCHHRTTLAVCFKVSWREKKSWMKSEECFLCDSFPTKSSDLWYYLLRYETQGGYFQWYDLPTPSSLPPQHIDHSKQINPRSFPQLYHIPLYLYLINIEAFPVIIH